MIENVIVIHKTFGRGKVLALDYKHLKVKFDSGEEKQFCTKIVLEKNLLDFEDLEQKDEILRKNEEVEEAERMKVAEQIRIEEEKKFEYAKALKRKLKEGEKRAKDELLNKLKSLKFEGFLHTTDIKNFKNIIDSGVLKLRKKALDDGSLVIDCAEQEVISKTKDDVQNSCRFYYYFKTPTNYDAAKKRLLQAAGNPCV